MSNVELKLSQSNRINRPSERLDGKIIIKSSSSISHNGVFLNVNGSVNLQIRGGSAGVIESFYGVLKPITIVKNMIKVRASGKTGSGTTEDGSYKTHVREIQCCDSTLVCSVRNPCPAAY